MGQNDQYALQEIHLRRVKKCFNKKIPAVNFPHWTAKDPIIICIPCYSDSKISFVVHDLWPYFHLAICIRYHKHAPIVQSSHYKGQQNLCDWLALDNNISADLKKLSKLYRVAPKGEEN